MDDSTKDKQPVVGLFADEPETISSEPVKPGNHAMSYVAAKYVGGDLVKRTVFERELRAFGSLKPDIMMAQWIATKEHETAMSGDNVGEDYLDAIIKVRQLHDENQLLRGHVRTLLELQDDDEELIEGLKRKVGSLQELYVQDGAKLTKLQDVVDGLEDQKTEAIRNLETIVTWRQLGEPVTKEVETLCLETIEGLKRRPLLVSGN